jgi:arylsulfatase A-like enzyme
MSYILRLGTIALVGVFLCCQPTSGPTNVLLIGIDTLRWDHLSCYGYPRLTTPSIDKLAGEGVRLETAISASPWTLPSFATVFTSLYPSQHGAGSLQSRLRTVFPTLAMMLLKNGYSTAGIANNATIGPDFKMDRGFEYYDLPPPVAERLADGTTEDALAWIDRNGEKPFFLFVHYFDPHLPYAPPPPYDSMFNESYSGPIGSSFSLATISGNDDLIYQQIRSLSEQDMNHIVSLYDGEIAFTDEAVGKLIAGLDERGLRGNTLVVLFADHGEEFLDHGRMDHGHTLFDELLRVPMIFSLPGTLPAGKVVSNQARLLDIAPTILDLLKIKTDNHLEGASLRPLLIGDGLPKAPKNSLLPAHVAFSGALLAGPDRKSARAYPWKLVYEVATGSTQLYNIETDPHEQVDVSADQPEVRTLLEETVVKTIFGLSDTWYVEMRGGGGSHTFDLRVSLRGPTGGSKIYLFGLIDSAGNIVDADESIASEATGTSIDIRDLRLSSSLTLAFKVEPKASAVRFDLRIDGKPAIPGTFIGKGLVEPEAMPFIQKGAPAGRDSQGEPETRPESACFLVWHSGGGIDDETPVRLDEETRKQLRALGYLH